MLITLVLQFINMINSAQIKTQLLLIVFLLSTGIVSAQIRFSENIQTSQTANHSENALFFIDFWATWCGPCVFANEYLEVLQKQNPDQFYVVSLSEETPDTVRRFLKKHPTELAVAIDYEGETFEAHNVRILPFGLLINADGKILWKGSPADFKQSDLDRYMHKNKKTRDISKVLTVKQIKAAKFERAYIPKADIEITRIKSETTDGLIITPSPNYVFYKGDLKSILAYHLKVLKSQIRIDSSLNSSYEIYVSNGLESRSNTSIEILETLGLDLFHSEVNGDAVVLDIETPTFWDTQQIDWGENTTNYLINDSQIQADNVTFKDVMYQLASVLELPVVTTNLDIDELEHDWQIHYKFYGLMQSDLLDNYGIKAEKKPSRYRIYNIAKKTP